MGRSSPGAVGTSLSEIVFMMNIGFIECRNTNAWRGVVYEYIGCS